MTSSKIRGTPFVRVISLSRCRNTGSVGMVPEVPPAGSRITPPISSSKSFSKAPMSLGGQRRTCPAASTKTPRPLPRPFGPARFQGEGGGVFDGVGGAAGDDLGAPVEELMGGGMGNEVK